MRTIDVVVADVQVGKRLRRLNPEKVTALCESITEIGLRSPIAVTEDCLLIAGLHRLEAFKRLGRKQIPGIVFADEALDAELAQIDENLIRAELTVLERGEHLARRKEIYEARHPETKKGGDRKSKEAKSKRNNSALIPFAQDTAAKTSQSRSTVEQEVRIAAGLSDEVREQIRDTPTANKKNELLSLARLKPDTQRAVAERIASGESRNVAEAQRQLVQGGGAKESRLQRLAKELEPLSDPEKMEKLNIKLRPYDVWNFAQCDELYGADYPGRIPGELVAHTLYFYSEPGDVIVDPMAGSGTTLDVCLAMGRKCYGYDMENRFERPDIIKHDLASGWPERTKKASLIFWDAPYFSKKDGAKAGQKDGYIEGSISRMDRGEYLAFFEQRFQELQALVKKGTTLAFLMSDWDDDTGKVPGIFLWDYADLLRKTRWAIIRQIQCPLSTQQVHPDIINKFREQKRLARLGRYLLIAES